AKGRVNPLQPMTIPQRELKAAVVAAQLVASARLVIPGLPCICYSDSTNTLNRILSEPAALEVYERNRVREILQLTQARDWRYVSTKLNPADLVSRGCTPTQLQANCLWWKGPDFLMEVENLAFHEPILPKNWSKP